MSAVERYQQFETDFFEDFFETLPRKPYCTNDFTYGLRILPKEKAIAFRNIQVNHPLRLNFLVFDVDINAPYAMFTFEEVGLPAPNWISKNKHNSHYHMGYWLEIPVCSTDFAKKKPIEFAAAILSAIGEKLQADTSYSGLTTKNPCHDAWHTVLFTKHRYSLHELADYLDLKGHPKKGKEASGLGRNCTIFDNVSNWAYKAIRDYWSPNYYDKWFESVLGRCMDENTQFNEPLPYSEIKAIAKSIAKWTYKHFTPSGLSEWHSKKGKIGGKKSKGGGRPSKKHLLPMVLELKDSGMTFKDIAEKLNVSDRTIRNWLKS